MIENILIAIFFVLALDFLLVGKLLITYSLSADKITVVLLRIFPMYIIPLESVEQITKAGAYKMLLGMSGVLRSRAFGANVFIARNTTWGKDIVVTPDNPDAFIAEVKRRVKEKTGRDI